MIALPARGAAGLHADFALWLPLHAGLVGTLDLGVVVVEDGERMLARSLYVFSLQQAAAAAQPLRLRSFTTGMPCACMIACLHAASLTRLELKWSVNSLHLSPPAAFTSGISKLQSLHELHLMDGPAEETCACLAALPELRHLTKVELTDCSWNSLGSLPCQLQCLSICSYDVVLDISHLSSLRDLYLYANSVVEGSPLSPSLTSLTIHSCSVPPHLIAHLSCLQQLRLDSVDSSDHTTVLSSLAALSQLQHVALDYDASQSGRDIAGAAAPMWKQLTQLQKLQVCLHPEGKQRQFENQAAVVAGLAAAKSLTKLVLARMHPPEGVNLCAHVSCLPILAELKLKRGTFSRQDALHLTGLTRLTSLTLYSCPAVDDAVAVALAHNHQQLLVLALDDCGMVSDALLPVLRGMLQLRSLSLIDCKGLKDDSWQLLVQLTQLTKLQLGGNRQLSEACRVQLRQAFGDRVGGFTGLTE